MVDVVTKDNQKVSAHAGKVSDALNIVDHFTSIPFAINRAITNGLFQIEGFASIVNSPLFYSMMMAPGMLLVLFNMSLQAFNQARQKRSLHSRIVEILASAAMLGLCISMFFGVAITLPLATIGLAKGIYDFFTHLSSWITGSLQTKIDNHVTTPREYCIETANKVHNIVVSALTVTGAAMLFTPLAPIGAAILLAVSIYTLALTISDIAGFNPFKWVVGKIYDAIASKEKTIEAKPLLTPTPQASLSSTAIVVKNTMTVASKNSDNTISKTVEIKHTRKLPVDYSNNISKMWSDKKTDLDKAIAIENNSIKLNA